MKPQFTALVIFGTWDEAASAKQALRAAGYNTQILDDVDDYSQATWVDVWRPIEAADCNDPRFDQEIRRLNAIVDPLGGLADEKAFGRPKEPIAVRFKYRNFAEFPRNNLCVPGAGAAR
jgi:hypothetical protein